NHQAEVVSGVMEEECGRLLSDFFRKLRAKKKAEKQNKAQ
ncbi:tRNA-specific adenosine deaminase, partial [Klebsiella pneumoniae]|nr:tRNA-specific adenosine deaminase [Klebsiella pneumoniae]